MKTEDMGWSLLPLLKRRIVEKTGLDCAQYKDKYLRRRIAVRMRALDVEDCGAYSRILRDDEDERDKLLEDLTINVTSFFRDPEVFDIIEKEVLPSIIHQKVSQKRRVIRLWSAGCASGEEAYSLAMLLSTLLGDELPDFVVSVLGTDIDCQSLVTAKKAAYLPGQVEDLDSEYLDKYFDSHGDSYTVIRDIRNMVRFRHLDLFSDKIERYFDLIVCRNVVIYFSKDTQSELFMDFHNSLTAGGYLVLGKTEMLLGESKELFHIINGAERIYQKCALTS